MEDNNQKKTSNRTYFLSFSKTFTCLLLECIGNIIENSDIEFDEFQKDLVEQSIDLTKKKIAEMPEKDLNIILKRYKEKTVCLEDESTYICNFDKFNTWFKNNMRKKVLNKYKLICEADIFDGKYGYYVKDLHYNLSRIFGQDLFVKYEYKIDKNKDKKEKEEKQKKQEETEIPTQKRQKLSSNFFQRFTIYVNNRDLRSHNNKLFSAIVNPTDEILNEFFNAHFYGEIINGRLYFRHPIYNPFDIEGVLYLDALNL